MDRVGEACTCLGRGVWYQFLGLTLHENNGCLSGKQIVALTEGQRCGQSDAYATPERGGHGPDCGKLTQHSPAMASCCDGLGKSAAVHACLLEVLRATPTLQSSSALREKNSRK